MALNCKALGRKVVSLIAADLEILESLHLREDSLTCPCTTLMCLAMVSQRIILQNLHQFEGLLFCRSHPAHCFQNQAWKGELVGKRIQPCGGSGQWHSAHVVARPVRHRPLVGESDLLEKLGSSGVREIENRKTGLARYHTTMTNARIDRE